MAAAMGRKCVETEISAFLTAALHNSTLMQLQPELAARKIMSQGSNQPAADQKAAPV